MTTRRSFLGSVGLGLFPASLLAQDQGGEPDGTQDEADRLFSPDWAGRARDTLTALDNDPVIIATESRMRCTCGCTLDIYTCRTTDFTCTFSPALHKEIIGMYTDGKTPEEIIAFFVEREGEAILMAPPAEGFNIAGYVVPGLVMATAMLGLAAWIARRREAVVAVANVAADADVPANVAPLDDAARDRLRSALDDVES